MIKKREVVIIDYGMGNIYSLYNALKYLGAKIEVVDNPSKISKSKILMLPGVGSFKKAMQQIKKKKIDEAIFIANEKRSYIFGICLGMQLFSLSSNEGGYTKGLGLISNKVEKFLPREIKNKKIPHVGFNEAKCEKSNKLFKGLKNNDFYFVHSYRMLKEKLSLDISTTNYGIEFLSSFHHENLFATQFHPEKSQENGLKLLENFLNLT
ncbi:imidazole glycerol phosphate synthase subunit HisH [Candidatus Pelagibacter bacterium]|jgi:imidazole glycerol-phosphate synthase subunit HisH|nr:imidazole glycerol phosphate synthase subunit HisH [Candidatus Pelagibacter bacterium]